jgi:hypothetical protein
VFELCENICLILAEMSGAAVRASSGSGGGCERSGDIVLVLAELAGGFLVLSCLGGPQLKTGYYVSAVRGLMVEVVYVVVLGALVLPVGAGRKVSKYSMICPA